MADALKFLADLEALDRSMGVSEVRLANLKVTTTDWLDGTEVEPVTDSSSNVHISAHDLRIDWTYSVSGRDVNDEAERYRIEATYEIIFSRSAGLMPILRDNAEIATSLGYNFEIEPSEVTAKNYALLYASPLVAPKFEALCQQICANLGVPPIKIDYWNRSPSRLLEAITIQAVKSAAETAEPKRTRATPSSTRKRAAPAAKSRKSAG